MLQKSARIAAFLLTFSPIAGKAAGCSLQEIASAALAAAAAASSAGQEQSKRLADEARRLTAAAKTVLNVVPEEQLPQSERARLATLKQQMTYLRVRSHYVAEAKTIEGEIAEMADVAKLLQAGGSVGDDARLSKLADGLHFLRQNFPEPKTELDAAAPTAACDLQSVLTALQHAAADELNAIALGEPMARIQKAARTYGLDMSRTAWENPAAWLSAIPSPQDRKRVSDDMALVRKARLEVAYINDLQNLTRLYTFSKTKFHVRDVELAQLARQQALERLGEAWSHYVSGASTEERKLSELLDFLQNADKPGAPERNAREPCAP